MYTKRVLFPIAISIPIMFLLIYFIYDFDGSMMNISNVFFLMGIVYFFPGLIIITGAMDIFYSIRYLTRRIFLKNKRNGSYFKTLSDYKDYMSINNVKYNTKSRGVYILLVGGGYILISIVISMIV